MVGEDKTAGSTFTAVACYSSTDLVHWTRQVNALSRQASGDLGPNRIVERPKVIYNSTTGKYVMWLHIDNTAYQDRRAGVATSNTPCGPYTYLGATGPLGHQSRDLGLYKDTDGTAYLMHDDPAGLLRIDRLSADYTTAQSAVASFPELEAPAIAKVGNRYFLLGSHLTGWGTNDNVYATATSLSGPWSSFTNVAPAGTRTYDSQTSFLLPVTGAAGTSYVYIGDRWNSNNLNASLPVWLPIALSGTGTAALSWYPSWGINTSTGSISLPVYRLTGNQSNRCLAMASQTNGAAALIRDCGDSASQTFAPSRDAELRVFGGQCLQAQGTATGSAVNLGTCSGGDNQKWMLSSDGSIVGVQSRLCLDVTGQATANGSPVQLWTCTGAANQKWTRTETSPPSPTESVHPSSSVTSPGPSGPASGSPSPSWSSPAPPSSPSQPSSPSAPAGATCQVTDTVNAWNTGLTESITITNTGSAAINGWSLGFPLPAGQTIVSGWNATYTPATGAVTATNVGYNGALAPGASVSIGFQATHTGNAAGPAGFTLNGVACSAA
jgi:Cellulose binding domain/Ricin-type beta-trefoil lectin domain/Glycosyl hydrolases family 43